MIKTKAQIWLVSGASRGIGLAIALEALEKGDCVVLGVRNLDDAKAVLADYPAQARAVRLDMDEPACFGPAVDACLSAFGSIDVLVNNAGYGLQGMIEELSMGEIRAQMETNFFGLAGLTQAVIPHMRGQSSGYIVNVSSIAGLRGSAALGIYNASKFAVEGFSEALAQEMAPFGVRVSIVEPGPYRTDWSGSSLKRSEAMRQSESGSPYAEKNKLIKDFFDSRSGKQPGDPRQIARVLFQASRAEQPPLHMLFGDIAAQMWEQRLDNFRDPSFISVYPHEKNTL